MSWFSQLTETYDRVSNIAGGPKNEGNILLPLNHMIAKTDICVTLDIEGNFRRAEECRLNIMIPCTAASSIRTSGDQPHPLHDQLSYLAMDKGKNEKYIAELEKWHQAHPKVEAVYKYLVGGTLLSDLRSEKIKVDAAEYDGRGEKLSDEDVKKEQDKILKWFVRFRVEAFGDSPPNLWEDWDVAEAWQNVCIAAQSKDSTLCYATGLHAPPAAKHPKGINASANSAKLISCNDDINYTYKGRFMKAGQASAISEIASHKAHAMLKYLIQTQGHKCDTQAVVAWAVESGEALPDPFMDSYDLYGDVTQTETDIQIEARGELGADYAIKLRDALRGKGNAADLANFSRRVAVMAVDAATTGRMGITFYQDLDENEYRDRIIAWHESCRWYFRRAKREYLSAPSADRIIAAVYGEPKGEGYKRIQKQARERMLHHIIGGEPLDRGWISAAVARVSNPFSYSKQDGGWDRWLWENALGVACAISYKYFHQKEGGFGLELERTCADRDYLFGRLLAVADRLESHARYLQTGKNDTEKRPTNAVRYMAAFAAKPLRTWKLIFDQLNPYIQRLDGAEWYQRQVDEIMALFNPEECSDKPLGGKYLLGYSLQRRALYNGNDDNNSDGEDVSE